jgi:hypothetical protein
MGFRLVIEVIGLTAAPPYKAFVRTAEKTPLSAVLSVLVLNSAGYDSVTVNYLRSCRLAVAVVSLSSNGCIRLNITSQSHIVWSIN